MIQPHEFQLNPAECKINPEAEKDFAKLYEESSEDEVYI